MSMTAHFSRREHGADPAHPTLTFAQSHIETVLLGGGQHASLLIDRRKPLEMTPGPGRSHLRAVPLAICAARQPFVPGLERGVENALKNVAFSRDDNHAAQRWIEPATRMSEFDECPPFSRTVRWKRP